MLKRAHGKSLNGSSEQLSATSAGPWQKEFPALTEFVLQSKWEDGKPRITGTVMFFVEDGRWKAWLHDRDQGLTAFVAGETLSQMMTAADSCISADSGDWRPDRSNPKGRKG